MEVTSRATESAINGAIWGMDESDESKKAASAANQFAMSALPSSTEARINGEVPITLRSPSASEKAGLQTASSFQSREVEAAMSALRAAGLDVRAVESQLQRAQDATPQPTAVDLSFVLVPSDHISEHLDEGENRPVLSCAIEKGRAYSLSPAQRDVLRERYGMTPAKLVEVVEIATFPGTQAIYRVMLLSQEHKDFNRKSVVKQFTLCPWSQFMQAVQVRDAERQQEREYAKFLSRIENLLHKAKSTIPPVVHDYRTAGGLAHRLHAEVSAQRAVDNPEQVREILRCMLISDGEHALSKLVKEPKYWPDDDRASGATQRSSPSQLFKNQSLTEMMGELEKAFG